MSEPEAQNKEQNVIIAIESDQSVMINIEDTGQDPNTSEITEDVLTARLNKNIDIKGRKKLNTHHADKIQTRRNERNTWVFLQLSDMTHSPVPPTGDPLIYDPKSRNSFVRHVFTLVFMMLMATFGISLMCNLMPSFQNIFADKLIALIVLVCSGILLFLMHYVMFCSECSRYPPCNYICLLIVTLVMSTVVAVVTSWFNLNIIMAAVAITAGIVLLCLGLACTSFDFTKWLLYFVVIAFGFAMASLVLMIGMLALNLYFKPLHIALLFGSILISAIGIVMELQMILGGKTVELGEDDYAIGAYMIYTSIIQMFLNILRLLERLNIM